MFSCNGRFIKNIQRLYDQKTVSEYDQEIPQSQTADNPMAPRGRAAQARKAMFAVLSKSRKLHLPVDIQLQLSD